ncbi:hypothetical protein Tco_0766614 [Tanacetum coccineum]
MVSKRVKRMASMDTRLNIKKLDGNILQKHKGSKQVRFKQLGPGVKTGVHGVSNDDTAVAQRRLEDKQPEEKTNTNFLSGLSKVFWAVDTTRSTYLVNMSLSSVIGFKKSIDILRLDEVTSNVVLYMNMGFNKRGEYKKTFIGSCVGTGSMQVLHGFEFEVKPLGGHTFEVEPQENVDQGAVAAVEKIYAHKSLNFNNTVAYEVISKWKAELKDDMDARSDVYVLNNGCRKCNDDNDGYYWDYTPAKGDVLGMEIVVDQSDNTLRVSQSRFYNEKLVQTLLKGHFILSLEGSLSGDCDMEKNGKLSCIYAVGSQEYQVVCTRLDITSADMDMLDKFDRGLHKVYGGLGSIM